MKQNGSGNWPTVENPLHIPAGKCTVGFISDGSGTEWGWQLTAASASEHGRQVATENGWAAAKAAAENDHTEVVELLRELGVTEDEVMAH